MVGRRKIKVLPSESKPNQAAIDSTTEEVSPVPAKRRSPKRREPVENDDRLPATIPDDLPDPIPEGMPPSYSQAKMKTLCESVSSGLSLTHSLRLLGLTKLFPTWRKPDKEFIDSQIAVAESAFVQDNINKIRDASGKYWQAAAWLLERRYPSQFSTNRGQKSNTGQGPVNILIVSTIPRPSDIMRRRGKRISELSATPDEIDAENAEVLEIVTNVPRLLEQGREDDDETA